MALFIPLAAIVFSLKNCEGYIRAILIKQLESEKLSKGAGKTLQQPCGVCIALANTAQSGICFTVDDHY